MKPGRFMDDKYCVIKGNDQMSIYINVPIVDNIEELENDLSNKSNVENFEKYGCVLFSNHIWRYGSYFENLPLTIKKDVLHYLRTLEGDCNNRLSKYKKAIEDIRKEFNE